MEAGVEYLKQIRAELDEGKRPRRSGVSILAAFGYVRRRRTAIDVITDAMKEIGLVADPPIDEEMPVDGRQIRFTLAEGNGPEPGYGATGTNHISDPTSAEEVPVSQSTTTSSEPAVLEISGMPTFKVDNLEAARREVVCVSGSESLQRAYTLMAVNAFSQLVVADSGKPRLSAIKGIISHESIIRKLMAGARPTMVSECVDATFRHVSVNDDISAVLGHLEQDAVVLVMDKENRLSGIITDWDLAYEFAVLVAPFRWIGEIERGMRACVERKIGHGDALRPYLGSSGQVEPDPARLNFGDLVSIVGNQDAWQQLGLAPLDRRTFLEDLEKVRLLRNRLMHFGDLPKLDERDKLKKVCQLVRMHFS